MKLKYMFNRDSVVALAHAIQKLTFSFDTKSLSDQPQNLMIDYVVYHTRA